MRPVVRLGPIVLHWEVLLVAVAVSAFGGVSTGIGLLIVIAAHELGHGLVAAVLRTSPPAELRIQLGSGEAYLRPGPGVSLRQLAVLASGALVGGPLAWAVGTGIERLGAPWGREIGQATRVLAVVWSAYQLSPFPVADLGGLLRRLLGGRVGPVWAWRVSWGLGLASAGIALFLVPVYFVVWLTGLAVVLGRSEAGHVRALEAFEAFEQGDLQQAKRLALRAPEHLPGTDRARLAELGVHAALELEDVAAMEKLVPRLEPTHPLALSGATWLLRQDRDQGAVVAERAHQRVDAGVAKALDAELYLDLVFYHAIHEATRLRPESALGLLERAVERGFDDRLRIEAEGGFDRVRGHPRMLRLLARLTP